MKVIKNKYNEEYIFPQDVRYIKKYNGYDVLDGKELPAIEVNGEVTITFNNNEEREEAINLLGGLK